MRISPPSIPPRDPGTRKPSLQTVLATNIDICEYLTIDWVPDLGKHTFLLVSVPALEIMSKDFRILQKKLCRRPSSEFSPSSRFRFVTRRSRSNSHRNSHMQIKECMFSCLRLSFKMLLSRYLMSKADCPGTTIWSSSAETLGTPISPRSWRLLIALECSRNPQGWLLL
jgi:hypothetical protein